MELKERVVLVTGAGVRLGRTIVLELAAAGAAVAVHYGSSRNEASGAVAAIRADGGDAEAFRLDLSETAALPGLVEQVLRRFGRLDVLVNNAAIFPHTPFDTVSEADWDRVMAVNLKAPFFLAQAAARPMRAQGAGKIINLADISAERPWSGYLPYCISKAGIVTLTRGLARALAPSIQVNAVAPGAILFPEHTSADEKERLLRSVPLGREGDPQDIARTVRFLIEGSDYITGVVLPVDGGRAVAG
jgi:NAD(P)-dependent dehydrogenase (short-subunit alcohol dehydrogenase family)